MKSFYLSASLAFLLRAGVLLALFGSTQAQTISSQNQSNSLPTTLEPTRCIPLTASPLQNQVNSSITWDRALCAPSDIRLPCLSNICLGDNLLQKLGAEQWIDFWRKLQDEVLQPASNVVTLGSKPDKSDRPQLPKQLPDTNKVRRSREFVRNQVIGLSESDKDILLLYTLAGNVDRRLLEIFERSRPTICRSIRLLASFKSESGYPTNVVVEAMAPGDLRVVAIERQYTFKTTDELSKDETRNVIASAHPLIFKYARDPDEDKLYVIDGRRVTAGGMVHSENPRVRYQLSPKKGDSSSIDLFDNSSQPGCAPKGQSIN